MSTKSKLRKITFSKVDSLMISGCIRKYQLVVIPIESFLEEMSYAHKAKRKMSICGYEFNATKSAKFISRLGCKCAHCGLKASIAVVESDHTDREFCANIYALDKQGNAIQMQKSKVLSKSVRDNDKSKESNGYQVLCHDCAMEPPPPGERPI